MSAGRSIAFCGCDLSGITSAVMREAAGVACVPKTAVVPGRAGELLLGGRLGPKDLSVALYLRLGYQPDREELEAAKREVSRALTQPGGGELRLPSGLTYRDCVLLAAGEWSSEAPDAWAELRFRAFDPIGYGLLLTQRVASFHVGGNWPTEPVVTMIAEAASWVRVSLGSIYVAVTGPFTGGEAVVVDFATGGVLVDGMAADERLEASSTFFALEPGGCELGFTNCSRFEVSYRERWA